MAYKPILSIDFDGVIHSYSSGWKGAHVIPDDPVPGAILALHQYLDAGFEVAIFSSRSKSVRGRWAMKRWMAEHVRDFYLNFTHQAPVTKTEAECVGMDMPGDDGPAREFVRRLSWPWFKPSAVLTIDDRAVCFNGTFPAVNAIKIFQPWNKRKGLVT